MPPSLPSGTVPRLVSALLGRDVDLAEVHGLLMAGVRLVTLTGPGGVGKTSLALAVAAEVAPHLDGGAVFVDVAPVRDPALVPASRRPGARGASRSVTNPSSGHWSGPWVGENCCSCWTIASRWLAGAAELAAALLAGCPRLAILATSRARLNLSQEQLYPLLPLALAATGARHPGAGTRLAGGGALRRARPPGPAGLFSHGGERRRRGRDLSSAGRAAPGDRVGRGPGRAAAAGRLAGAGWSRACRC